MRYLVLDCDAVCWAIHHSLPEMSHNKSRTEIIYGFFNQLFYFQGFEKADRIIFCWDSKFSKRTELFPDYKITRRNKKEERTPEEKEADKVRRYQFKILRTRVLPALGFKNIWYQAGYEGDDLIASATSHPDISSNDYIKIIARDKDLFQLVSNTCHMYDWVEGVLHTPESLFERFGVWPDTWAEVMSMSGCTTDDVPGIPGIGHGYAIKYLLNKLGTHTKTYQKIVGGCDERELSRLLTTLPFEGTTQPMICQDECDPTQLKRIARTYGLNSYLKRLPEFKELFCEKKT